MRNASRAEAPTERVELPPIGRPGEPIRGFAFTAGGFDTAMQLGVAHALLVSQRKPPDVVVGVSAGAVNAVALADIMRAGNEAERLCSRDQSLEKRWHVRMAARVARFREIFEAFQRAPSDITNALLPDAYQVNAEAPLQPVKLPIHFEAERKHRRKAVEAKAGLINLYNQLLNVRLSIGTITRIVRAVLGYRAAGDLREPLRTIGRTFELFRLWTVIGANLPRLAHLVDPVLRGLTNPRALLDEGATAAQLLFRSRSWSALRNSLMYLVALIGTTAVWASISIVVVGLAVVMLGAPYLLVTAWRIGWRAAITDPRWWITGTYACLAVFGVMLFLSWLLVRQSRGLRVVLGEISSFIVILAGAVSSLVAMSVIIVRLVERALSLVPAHPIRRLSDLSAVAIGTWPHARTVLVVAFIVSVVVVAALAVAVGIASPRRILLRLLRRYEIADALLSPHALRQQFVTLFDPDYYGPMAIDKVVDRAIRRDNSPERGSSANDDTPPADARRICAFAPPGDPDGIYVGVAAADVRTGELQVLSDDVPIVDALLAAFAVTPLFPPKMLTVNGERRMFIDGSNVGNEPTRALIDFLRARANRKATALHVYPVAALPFSRTELNDGISPLHTLIGVVRRALQLQRFRDATLERRLTELYTSVMPSGNGVVVAVEPPASTTGGSDNGEKHEFLRTSVFPIEPPYPLDSGGRLIAAPAPEQRREIIAETVADGCRAALQAMVLTPSKESMVTPVSAAVHGRALRVVSCRVAIKAHLESEASSLPDEIVRCGSEWHVLPGGAADGTGPGLREVCSHCAIRATDLGEDPEVAKARLTAALDWVTPATPRPVWPHELQRSSQAAQVHAQHDGVAPSESCEKRADERGDPAWDPDAAAQTSTLAGWPRIREASGDERRKSDRSRPTVSLLFSGGVFRGVYQVGVLNALEEAGVRPDVVAGASVGSITAAMVAEVLSRRNGDATIDEKARHRQIASLAATYLAVDRLILTDRFADFIRGFTLRAAATRFSVEDADRLFRRYDSAQAAAFDHSARRVIAGLERLLYINPFELKDLVRAFRNQELASASTLLSHYVREWLERMGVGDQVLGAEPLELLIYEHVLKRLRAAAGSGQVSDIPLRTFLDRGVLFLATTTNLVRGRLEVLGEHQFNGEHSDAMMVESLLASSAFPGVFRPRWSWELLPGQAAFDQYIDGGVMDNLPLDAVARFLYQAGEAGRISKRPRVGAKQIPHLLFSASLEVHHPELSEDDARSLCEDWPGLYRRARQLSYNKKLGTYAAAQRNLRRIYETAIAAGRRPEREPLDLHVVMVQPRWLCGTFAFHPMLGFRRKKQAASIAHGCASTLVALAREQHVYEREPWLRAWGIEPGRLPPRAQVVADRDALTPNKNAKNGECWFRPDKPCPFSRQSLESFREPKPKGRELPTVPPDVPWMGNATIDALCGIYEACGKDATHGVSMKRARRVERGAP